MTLSDILIDRIIMMQRGTRVYPIMQASIRVWLIDWESSAPSFVRYWYEEGLR
jgi:hypothetical protein